MIQVGCARQTSVVWSQVCHSFSPARPCAGPSGFTAEQGGFCYAAFFNGGAGLTWTAAQAQCVAAGGVKANLASIRDAAQKLAVLDNRCAGLVPAGYYWHVGLHDQHTEGTFQFVSGFNPAYARNNLFAVGQVRGCCRCALTLVLPRNIRPLLGMHFCFDSCCVCHCSRTTSWARRTACTPGRAAC